VDSLHGHLAEKVRTIQDTQRLLRNSGEFNHRQIALLGHALGNPEQWYTVQSHATSHQVTPPTARADLERLAALDFLTLGRDGKRVMYGSRPDLESRLRTFGAAKSDPA
jgi:Fic family protein